MATSTLKNKYIYFAIIFAFFIVVALYINNAYQALKPPSLPSGTVTLSQSAFEEKYGLHVNLVAVTGAGGFVDVRLKMVDADKAKLLLADAKKFPSLFAKNGVMLTAPEDTKSQKIEFITGGGLYIMYQNGGNSVQRGDPVMLVFGDTAVESINAR